MSIKSHTDSIRHELFQFEDRALRNSTADEDRKAMRTLAAEFVRKLGCIAGTMGGERRYFDGAEDALFDAIDEAFFKAIEAEDEAEQASSCPVEQSYAKGDELHDRLEAAE